MKKFENTCEICKFYSRFDRYCRVHSSRERPDSRACVHFQAHEKRIEQMRQAKYRKLITDIQSGEIDPREGDVLERIGTMHGGWAYLRSYNPETHECNIEIVPFEQKVQVTDMKGQTITVTINTKEQQQ